MKGAVLQRTASAGILPELVHGGFDGGAVIGMEQLETSRADHLFLRVAQDALDGWTGVTDLAVSVADAENVVAIFDDEAETLAGHVKCAVRRRGIGDFPQDTTNQRAAFDIYGTDADGEQKLTAVRADRGELEFDAGGPLWRRLGVSGDLLEIFRAKKIGKQNIKMQAEQFIVAVAKEFLGLRMGYEQGSGHSISEGKAVLSHSSFCSAK